MEKPACELLVRLLDLLLEHEPDIPQPVFEWILDAMKYLRRECIRERSLENPPQLA